MIHTRDTLLRGTTTVTVEQAIAYAASLGAKGPCRQYLRFCWRWAPGLGLNPLAVMAQWCDETSTTIDGVLVPGTSERWLNGDPAGIGIFSDDTVSTLPSGLSGEQSAAIHLVELYTKINRHKPPSGLVDEINVSLIDPHLSRVLQFVARPDWPAIRTLDDLRIPLAGNDFTWAANQQYGAQIAQHMNRIEQFAHSESQNQEEPKPVSTITFGRVPKPAVIERHLPTPNPYIGYSSEPIVVEGVVWHRMIGSLWGTDEYFHGGKAATAYGIGVAAQDGASNAGKIIEWIDPDNRHLYGESSGRVSNPYGDGLKFVNRFGVSRVNPQTIAIEISGITYTVPLDDAARDSIAALTAYFADRRGIPWNEFPIVPGQDRSFVIWHQEFTIGTGKICPGPVVMNETNALIERTRAVMKQYQDAAAPEIPDPSVPSGPHKPGLISWDIGDTGVKTMENGTRVLAMKLQVTAKKKHHRRVAASAKAKTSGSDVEPNDVFDCIGSTDSGWIFINDGPDPNRPSRVLRSNYYPLVPRPQDAA